MENITLSGYIGTDANCKQQSENKYLTHFPVAVSRKWKDKETGEEKESTNWYSIFRRSSKHPQKLLDHLKKGNKILITGQPSYNVNTHGQGVKVEVIINCSDLEILTFDKSVSQ